MNKRIAVYTAIFGPYDGLIPQKQYDGIDYLCFTDQEFKSNTWKIIKVEPVIDGAGMDNRRVKILPHLFLDAYEVSIYIDGNFLLRKNPIPLIETALKDDDMAYFSHNATNGDQRDCVYLEAEALYELAKMGQPKESPEKIEKQMNRYRSEGFPANYGLISGGVLIRKHHTPLVIKVMEGWWNELKRESRRDQLSFNYVAWKHKFKAYVLKGDIRNNTYFYMIGVHRKNYTWKYLRYRLKSALGLLRDH